ncbi:globin [Brevibacillus fulvus]|uniref:Hemoglobin n=1 Tax=Brevibacillus fulvus TaxID=1125967 RepID=A0A938Y107_9BACL|nr:globin [Brevibacillus fulvus]MBM7591939.1 hemoglobin [Brevibacillus fulvus]
MANETTAYEQIGGAETISRLVHTFYALVQRHPDLAPIFPEDLTETKNKQYMFLTQFLGGPPLYSERFGHPMLRARHMPFPITPKRAEAWLSCMNQAMDKIGLEGELRNEIFSRLTLTAHHMVNQWDDASE